MADDSKAGEEQGEEDDVKMLEPRGESPSSSLTMGKYSREFWFVMGLIFTAFATFQNGPLRTRKANPPQKFFSPSALVTDYEQGNLADLTNRLLENDVSFVMYYAPWDAQSLDARTEFQILAKYYHFQVFFAAINCWWPEGQCHQYHKLQSYPVLVAHVRRSGEIPYRGPLVASYMIAFLDHVLNPIVPVQHEGEILDLQTQHNAVLLGFFDFHRSPQPPGYQEFHLASLKALKQDPWRQVAFAVISNKKLAEHLKMRDNSSVVLYLWNTTEVYPGNLLKPDELVTWVYTNLKQVTRWVNFPVAKSKLLSQLLENSPTLLLFTPRSLVFGISPYFDMMREVAMDYYNCDNAAQVTSIIHRSVLRRHLLQEKFIELKDRCEEAKLWENMTMNETIDFPEGDACCQSMVLSSEQSLFTRNCFCMACVHYNKEKCPSGCKKFNCIATASRFLYNFKFDELQSSFAKCGDVRTSYQPKYTPYYFVSLRCFGKDPHLSLDEDEYGYEVGLHGLKDDKITTMIRHFKKEHCLRLDLGLNYSGLYFPDMPIYDGASLWSANFTGLGCARNYSLLRFAGIDSVLFYPFAEKLGVDVLNETHQTFAVIVDAEKESHYVLNGGINKKVLVEFIKNYTDGLLGRHLRSSGEDLPCSDDKDVICVKEVSSMRFLKEVLDPKKDVVLLYYAPWCGFCHSIAHIFLTVAKFFANVKTISFARINGDANDLPWEYTVDRYPTLLFFPAYRKAESVLFPPNEQITVASLVQFVIMNAQPKVRWEVALEVCSRNCLAKNLLRSAEEQRKLFLQIRRHRNHLAFSLSHLSVVARSRSPRRRCSLQEDVLRDYINYLVQEFRSKKAKIKQLQLLADFLRRRLKSPISESIEETGAELDMLMFFDQLEKLKAEALRTQVTLKKRETVKAPRKTSKPQELEPKPPVEIKKEDTVERKKEKDAKISKPKSVKSDGEESSPISKKLNKVSGQKESNIIENKDTPKPKIAKKEPSGQITKKTTSESSSPSSRVPETKTASSSIKSEATRSPSSARDHLPLSEFKPILKAPAKSSIKKDATKSDEDLKSSKSAAESAASKITNKSPRSVIERTEDKAKETKPKSASKGKS